MVVVETKLRYNETTEEVELVYGDEVALTSDPEVFKSWVDRYNDTHTVSLTDEEREAFEAEIAALKAEVEALKTPAPTPEELATVEEKVTDVEETA